MSFLVGSTCILELNHLVNQYVKYMVVEGVGFIAETSREVGTGLGWISEFL